MITIFVQRASNCLTDHLSHGDGLICFSLLKGLAERGHRIFAFTDHNGVQNPVPNLTTMEYKHRTPANGLADWEYSWRADQWLKKIIRTEKVDVVWRMHPYGASCPMVPFGRPRPLVVGPLFYSWPQVTVTHSGKPRLGVGLRPLVMPIAEAGWMRTLKTASLVLCATKHHAQCVRQQIGVPVEEVPVIVDVPEQDPVPRVLLEVGEPLRLAFVANLVSYKHPKIFCEAIRLLNDRAIPVEGTIVGNGPELAGLQTWCKFNGISGNLQFLGKVPNNAVFQHLAEASLLLSTSFGEPYGRSIVEAMAVGTPAICHRSGGPVDIIRDNVDGFFVDALQASSYADIAERLYRQPSLLRDASIAARDRAVEWTSKAVIDRVENALIEVTRPSRANRAVCEDLPPM